MAVNPHFFPFVFLLGPLQGTGLALFGVWFFTIMGLTPNGPSGNAFEVRSM
jgi:hypothetical protein